MLEMVACSGRTGEWAIPGGMVEAGQVVSAQVKKEFEEECFAGDSKEHGEENRKRLEWIFHRGVEVYRGYVDDPRNTDHAWMETTAMHFHISSPELADALKLGSGDSADVKRVTWSDGSIHEPSTALYASHRGSPTAAQRWPAERRGVPRARVAPLRQGGARVVSHRCLGSSRRVITRRVLQRPGHRRHLRRRHQAPT